MKGFPGCLALPSAHADCAGVCGAQLGKVAPTRRGVASAGPDAAGAKPGARRGGGGRAPATHPRPRETRTRGRSRPVPFRLPATAGYGPDAPAPSIFRAS